MLGAEDSERTFTVLIDELLGHLTKNREEHQRIVVEAQAKFREMAIKRLDQMLVDAKAGRRIKMQVDLQVPTKHIEAYDNAICVLEMTKRAHDAEQQNLMENSTDPENPMKPAPAVVEITSDECERFVRNNWSWSRQFSVSNAPYSGLA